MKKALFAAAMTAMIAGAGVMSQAVPLAQAKIDISGLAQTYYSYGEGAGQNDQLEINRARLKLVAAASDNIAITSQYEFSQITANTHLLDLYADFKFDNTALTVKAGQFALPFAYEAVICPYDYALASTNYFTNAFATRDRGVMVAYPFSNMVEGKAWVSNGVAANLDGVQATTDDRNDFGAMIEVKPVDGLSFKAFGNYINRMPAASTTETDGIFYGAGFKYDYSGFSFASEYGVEDLDNKNTVTGVKTSADTDVWYAQAAYKIPETNLQAVARFDGDNGNDNTTLGINWDFDKSARFQFQHNFAENDDQDISVAQLSVRF